MLLWLGVCREIGWKCESYRLTDNCVVFSDESFLQGDNSSWISYISAHPGSEALTAIYFRLCLQRCLMANSLGRCRWCLPPEKRGGVFIGQNNKDKSPCRGKVRHAACPLEKIQSPWALGSSVVQPNGCVSAVSAVPGGKWGRGTGCTDANTLVTVTVVCNKLPLFSLWPRNAGSPSSTHDTDKLAS